MAFEQKPGSFALFKNDKEGVETRPDYKGDGITIDGTPVWVSAWIKEGKNGKFMSCTMKAKEDKPSKPQGKQTSDDVDDDIPF